MNTNSPLLLAINPVYIKKILQWKDVEFSSVGHLVKINNFIDHANLVDINGIFANRPMGDIVDRTESVINPFNFKVQRPWRIPELPVALDDVMSQRANYFLSQNKKINLFWSGGIDSTAVVAAFLQNCGNIDQLRLIYSPYSLYENQNFFNFITAAFPNLETIDISGEIYLHKTFDGFIITGHGGDEFTASLDESFVERVGLEQLFGSWKDYFLKQNQSHQLIEFCEGYFSLAGRPVKSLLDARWWFYSTAKSQVFTSRDSVFLPDNSSMDSLNGFFDCQEFENYMWFNVDEIIKPGTDYTSYKKFLRKYTYNFFKDNDYLNNKKKFSSMQLPKYIAKKTQLLDNDWIFKLENLKSVRTPNLPLLSQKEFIQVNGNRYDYLFNF